MGRQQIAYRLCLNILAHGEKEANDLLHNLSLRSCDSKVEFKTYWRRRIGISIQNCNCNVIFKKLDTLANNYNVVSGDLWGIQSHAR